MPQKMIFLKKKEGNLNFYLFIIYLKLYQATIILHHWKKEIAFKWI